jgi:glycosyltransferase involved in cell wall biosynthesis
MVGPVVKVDPSLLPHSPNLYFMGGRDYQVLPNYCAAFDICMMPFAMNASTQYINPTKGLEYMATERPIISTPVRDVVRQWSDIVEIVRSADNFIAAAERLLNNKDHRAERVQRGLERARSSSWENTVGTMQRLIKEAIGKSDRRSKQKIAPLTEAELEYQYQYTPGS